MGGLSPLYWHQGYHDLWAKRPLGAGRCPPPAPDPRPGAPQPLPARTLAPRSLSPSKSPVPSTKLLPLAREGKEGDKSKQRTEIIPLQKAFQPLRTIWKPGAGRGEQPERAPKVLLGRAPL